jgi:cyclic beta-1,2-glucan synthetase
MAPCLPRGWPRADVTWRYRTAVYAIAIENPSGVSVGVSAIRLDGTRLADGVDSVTLNDDGRLHTLVIRLGPDV